jgi:hypothetical protein
MKRFYAALAMTGILAAACDRADREVPQSDGSAGTDAAYIEEQSSRVMPGPMPAPTQENIAIVAPAIGEAAGQPMPTLPDSTRTTMLIRNGHARIEVESIEPAVAAVQKLARDAGAYITNTAMESIDKRARTATLTLRVPAANFDRVLNGLEPLGDVEHVNVTSEDVGEQYMDAGVRLQNSRRLETRLLELLETRTGRLEDVLAVERELARVREEIERMEGRMRYLRNRADVSTLTVELHEPQPLLTNYEGDNVIAGALRQSWRNFVGFIAGAIAALGVLVPLAAVVVLIAWLWRRKRRRGDFGTTRNEAEG